MWQVLQDFSADSITGCKICSLFHCYSFRTVLFDHDGIFKLASKMVEDCSCLFVSLWYYDGASSPRRGPPVVDRKSLVLFFQQTTEDEPVSIKLVRFRWCR